LPILYGIYELVSNEAGPLTKYDDNLVFFTLIASLIVASSFVAKFNYHEDYVAYVAKILRAFIISNIYSFIVFVGVSAIVFALDSLFKFSFGSLVYLRIGIFSFILFNVITFFLRFSKGEGLLYRLQVSQTL